MLQSEWITAVVYPFMNIEDYKDQKMIKMKKLTQKLLFVLSVVIATSTAVAQVKVTPKVDANTGKKALESEKRLKEIAAKEAAVNKILNATLTDVKFNVYNDKPDVGWFKKKIITLKGNGANKFSLTGRYLDGQATNMKTENGKQSWKFNTQTGDGGGTNDANKGFMISDTYRSFLTNGFNVTVNFSERQDRIKDQEFSTNLSVSFIFSNGTVVEIPLQGITIGTNPKGSLTAAPTKDFTLYKSFPGSEFPDPNNPLVLPTIK